uniref:Uncharacterized protein n=2 Tax=Rhizophora mucronata TaxID=61149 RepID=A0A2P2K3V4_RHIMU
MEAGLQLEEQRSSDCVTFSEIENFTNLIDSSNEQLHFGFSNLLNQQGLDQGHGQDQDQLWQHQKMGHGMGWSNGEEMMKMQDVFGRGGGGGGGLIDDQTVQVEYSRFGGLDWQGAGDHGLFDLHTAVDQVYWSSQNQWTDQDHSSLYLPSKRGIRTGR